MLEIKISVKIEGLDRLADALFAIVGINGKPEETASTPAAGAAEQTAAPIQQAALPAQQAAAPVQQVAAPVQQEQQQSMPATPTAQAPFPAVQAGMPAMPPAQQAAAPVTPPVQAAPPAQQAAAVPVSATSYSMDDLAHAAMALMDAGKQAGLQALLANFGVESLPLLPPEHYGAFATGMREMGAQI